MSEVCIPQSVLRAHWVQEYSWPCTDHDHDPPEDTFWLECRCGRRFEHRDQVAAVKQYVEHVAALAPVQDTAGALSDSYLPDWDQSDGISPEAEEALDNVTTADLLPPEVMGQTRLGGRYMVGRQLPLLLRDDFTQSSKAVFLPREMPQVIAPPIKCQGIKTKLVPFIGRSIRWSGQGRWIEPFLGSGVVLFNVAPQRAQVCDTNVHIIRLYQEIASGLLTPSAARKHLEREGERLRKSEAAYYYEVRDRFNADPSSLDFLFLNRSCFNGVMRFNRKGQFNVPSGRKPERFRQAYITKIANQIAYVWRVMSDKQWEFAVGGWRDCLNDANEGDFVYADPPYAGRHTDYYNSWSADEASELMRRLRGLPCGFALSTWKENKYRSNPYLDEAARGVAIRTTMHFYHVGPAEDNRNAMEEALIIKSGYEAD